MSEKKKVVIVGTGFGGVYTAKNLRRLLGNKDEIEVAMIGPQNYFLFTPLLHEVATGAIKPSNIIEPLRTSLHKIVSHFHFGKAEKINLKNKTIEVAEKVIPYDFLVLAPGSETNFYNIPGAKENSYTLKSAEDALTIKKKVICQMEKASHLIDRAQRQKMLTFAIVGGGPTGVELAIELQELIKNSFKNLYSKDLIEDACVVLIHRGKEILPQFSLKIRQKSLEVLQREGVKVELETAVTDVKINQIITNKKMIDAGMIIWVAGVKPVEIKFDEEVHKIENGKIVVNDFMQLTANPDVFVLGDISARQQDGEDLPALAQVAEREAEIVAYNIHASIKNKKLKTFRYKHRGSLLSLGQWMAAGQIGQISFWGHFTWWLWRTIYLSKLLSLRKKFNVAMDWTLNLFSPRDISEV